MNKTYINSILIIIFMVFIAIESFFIFTVIRVHQFAAVQVKAMKRFLLALSPSQVWAHYTIALTLLELYTHYRVDSKF